MIHDTGPGYELPGTLFNLDRDSSADLFLPEKASAFDFKVIDGVYNPGASRIIFLDTVGLDPGPPVYEPRSWRDVRDLEASFR